MKAGHRTTLTAVAISCGIVAAHAQTTDATTAPLAAAAVVAPSGLPPVPPMPGAPAPALPTPSDAASIANTTAALPPPAAIAGAPAAASGSNLSRPDFVKAIWVDGQGTGLRSAAAIKKMVADIRQAGFDTIYAQVRANGDALYSTTLAPKQNGLPADLDPLKLLIEEAKAGDKPLKVHALLVAYRVWSSTSDAPADHVTKQHADWVTAAEDGSKSMENAETWLDPGVTGVQDHLALIATDLVKNYAVDGVQLDRIRYPELDLKKNPNGKLATGYAQAAVDRYNQEKGKSGRPAPTDAEWVAWRRDQVTETVRKIREAVRAVRPAVELSVGSVTFGPPPQSREEYISKSTPYASVMEDWVGWSEKGLIDANVLMDFKLADAKTIDFEKWEDFALSNKGKAKVIIGVGGFLNDPRYTAAQMLIPIFQPRADGVALYGYNDTYKDTQFDKNLSFVAPILDAANLSAKAADVLSAVSKPLADNAASAEQVAKLDAVATAAGVNAPVVAAAPAAAVSPAGSTIPVLPQLGASSGSTNANMPALSAASSNVAPSNVAGAMPALPSSASAATIGASGLPNLGSAAGNAAGSGSLPTLPGTTNAAGMPTLASAPPAGASNMPSLPSASAASGPSTSMPSLSAAAAAPVAANMPSLPSSNAATGLPALTDAIPGASASSPLPPLSSVNAPAPVTAMPSLPAADTAIASAPALPSLSAPALPSSAAMANLAVPSTTPEAQKVVPQAPDLVAPIAPPNPMGTPAPGITFPADAAGVIPSSANAAVTVEPPMGTPITSIAPIPGGPPTTTFSVPGTTAKTTVNIPSLGGSTNFDGKPIAAAAPASPLITPPTVLTPAAGQTNLNQPINVGKQTVMDAPKIQRMDYSEPQSAYGTPNPPTQIRNFTTANIRKETKDMIAMPPSPAPLEVIVLKSGKEFAGRVLQRGSIWHIQLPNGSIMNIPGEKIATTRSTESAPLGVAATPVAL